MNIQSIRTFVAALVGVLIVRIIGALPTVAAGFAWVDGVFAEAGYVGISALAIVQAVVTAGVILGYQKIAQRIGDRWPDAEKFMLGSSARPSYEPRYSE